jgi:hypothetical protein
LQTYLSANKSDNYKNAKSYHNVEDVSNSGSTSQAAINSKTSAKVVGKFNKATYRVLRKSSIRCVLYIIISPTDTSDTLRRCYTNC